MATAKDSFEALITWSQQFANLPWRQKRSPYTTLVSEIMLQQTTVSTVLGKFSAFIAKFPNLQALAAATPQDITIAWKGLGYYRRANNLHCGAKELVAKHQATIPACGQTLKDISGIGDYTAAAILALAYEQRALALDTNIERVLARFYGLDTPKGPKLRKKLHELFTQGKILKDTKDFRGINEALMDLGRVICQAKQTNCLLCPLAQNCASSDHPLARPVLQLQKTVKKEELQLLRLLVINASDQIMVYQKKPEQWLAGQWECPTFMLECTDNKLNQYPQLSKQSLTNLVSYNTTITKYKITNYVQLLTPKEFQDHYPWPYPLKFTAPSNQAANLSVATQKALKVADF